ncbi:hypothetical protein CPLU01_01308 [Colletotrichum plurivorum]|uniref:Uncharacterized protein n=1 Tax=Colletotrichum plurivorum TaxID=2175906 RepID=A0A8H6U379_9PEZI|nr:hypothetical protein CPLU01_01308 [Colletotrichum plurivorum]
MNTEIQVHGCGHVGVRGMDSVLCRFSSTRVTDDTEGVFDPATAVSFIPAAKNNTATSITTNTTQKKQNLLDDVLTGPIITPDPGFYGGSQPYGARLRTKASTVAPADVSNWTGLAEPAWNEGTAQRDDGASETGEGGRIARLASLSLI